MTRIRTKGITPKALGSKFQTFAPPGPMLEWMDRCRISRGLARSYLGKQALLIYFHTYNYSEAWLSIEELLWSPDHKRDNGRYRNQHHITGYAHKSYDSWISTLPNVANAYLEDRGPDRVKEIRDKFHYRLKQVKRRSLHFNRAIKIYYKICHVNPGIIEIDFDLIRPVEYWWEEHNFSNINYLRAYTEKISQKLNIDLTQPPDINLYQPDYEY